MPKTNLKERLRDARIDDLMKAWELRNEAADHIEKLERNVATLTVCLKEAMDTIKNPNRDPTEKLASLIHELRKIDHAKE